MPFNPRVIGEDPLPDDFNSNEFGGDDQLEALGAQLLDDARQLANVYPAKARDISEPAPLKDAAVAPSRRLYWLTAIAAACVGAFGFVLPAAWKLASPPHAVVAVPESSVTVTEPTAIPSPTEPVPATRPLLTPVVQQGFTGPEWEAVLDLLESDSEQEQSISL